MIYIYIDDFNMIDKNNDFDKILMEAMEQVTFEGEDEDDFEEAGDLMMSDDMAIKRSYSLEEYTDHAKLAYAFLTSYGFHREVTIVNEDAHDFDSAMSTLTEDNIHSYSDFEKIYNKSHRLVMGIASFDPDDRERYGIFIVPGEKPVLTVYCDVMDEDVDCLFAELDQKYDDLQNGIERDENGMPI